MSLSDVKAVLSAVVRGVANGLFVVVAIHLAQMVPLNMLGLDYVAQDVPAWVVAGSLLFWFVLGALTFGPRRDALAWHHALPGRAWQSTPIGVFLGAPYFVRHAVRAWVTAGGFATMFRPARRAQRLATLLESLRASVCAAGGDTILVPTWRRLGVGAFLSAYISLSVFVFMIVAVCAGVGLIDAIPDAVQYAIALVPIASVALAVSGSAATMRARGLGDAALLAAAIDAADGVIVEGVGRDV